MCSQMLEQIGRQCHGKMIEGEGQNYEGSGVMNSRPKQKPLRERTMAGIREGTGVSNSISSKSPGFSRIPAYNTMPPSLISVPRPSTTVVEKPFEVTTRTGMSTGRRGQRRVFSEFDILPIIVVAAALFKLLR